MGKAEKTGIGRALVKHHNHTIQEIKEKGKFYRNQQKNVLESVTDVTDIEAIIEQADESFRLFSVNHPPANVLINLDSSSSTSQMAPKELREQRLKEETLHASSLRIPRRPPWNAKMSVEELDANERRAFLSWRRSLVSIEENEKLVLTPFEKNLDIWRQLWRVVERSDLVVMVVDARDPLFYHFPDLEAYAKEVDEHKRTLILINKADLLPSSVREKWAEYFHLNGILFIFWSAKVATDTLGAVSIQDHHESDDTDTKIHGREELLARLQYEAEKVVSIRNKSEPNVSDTSVDETGNLNSKFKGVIVGFVGYPNVGKSSTINALVGEKRAGVTSTPGKTKHFQTLIISDQLMLCDCPGLVFPSFTSSRYEMIASGVLPIDKLTEHREAVQVVANRVPRHVIENVYNISLPKPKPYESQSRPPLASELLRAYCVSRGYVASSGLPDETKASRLILKDYINGKLPHYELPPGENEEEDSEGGVLSPVSESEPESESEDVETDVKNESRASLNHVLDDMSSFDMANGIESVEQKKARKKASSVAHKMHKKPHRKKDRSWRVRADGSDGMPMVRVFQKSISAGPLNPLD